MATHRVSILGALHPDSSDVFPEPLSVKGSNDQWKHLAWIFNDTSAREKLHGVFQVPENYSSGAVLKVYWTSSATSGDVEWDFDYRAVGGDDAESLDQTGTQETVNVADTAPSAAFERMEATLTLTDGNFAAGDLVQFILARDGADAGDTMTAAAILVEAAFEYADA